MELLPGAQSSYQNEIFVSTSKNLLKKSNWTFPVVRYFTWKLEVCLDNFRSSKVFDTVLT